MNRETSALETVFRLDLGGPREPETTIGQLRAFVDAAEKSGADSTTPVSLLLFNPDGLLWEEAFISGPTDCLASTRLEVCINDKEQTELAALTERRRTAASTHREGRMSDEDLAHLAALPALAATRRAAAKAADEAR